MASSSALTSSVNVDLAFLDQSQQGFQVVKCVVVGDSGVGKSRLVCTRACDSRFTLSKLMQSHAPTVWAIDHYRNDREVLDRSWCTVDGLRISLRLWDTFGYHDKDRRFAYGRADVILLCFSVVRPRTLRNVRQHWYPEIKRFCPGVAIILCGCQADLRYLYLDEKFIRMDKGPFFREIKEADILLPSEGRNAAKEMGAYYYETSALVPFGIDDVFLNCVRAALVSKRDKHFWNVLGNLKRISKPVSQQPLLTPQPPAPEVIIPPLGLDQDLAKLLDDQTYCDVIFQAQGVCLQAHKVCLVAASALFEELFLSDFNELPLVPPADYGGNLPEGEPPPSLHSDLVGLLDNEVIETDSNVEALDGTSRCLKLHTLIHPAFQTIKLQQCEDPYNPGCTVLQTVVTLNDNITATAFREVLLYLYTGQCTVKRELLPSVQTAADLLGLTDLATIVTNLMNNEGFLNKDIPNRFHSWRSARLRELFIEKDYISDVLFEVDDGIVSAHKVLLTLHCDVMASMFSNNFRESFAKTVSFPGVSSLTFRALQDYLYTGYCPLMSQVDCLEMVEIANRLCLPRLVALAEHFLVTDLTLASERGTAIFEDVIALLEPAQLHNADQLAAWCEWFLCINYHTVYRKHAKLLQSLRPDIQVALCKRRWPPVWYLQEMDYYEKCLLDVEREKPIRSYARRGSDDIDSGCLGFCSRKNRRLKCSPNPTAAVAM